jgi:hypothetical protein
MDHPPYSPELAPADFWDVENMKSCVKKKFGHIRVQNLKRCFRQWLKHWEHCKELEGDCFEKF